MTEDDRPQEPDRIGEVFGGRFRIDGHIARGGMGEVYRATQLGVDRAVALKVLRPEMVDDEEVVARFDRELRTTARVAHPNTATVYDHGVTDSGELYLAMELVGGRELAEVMAEEGPLTADRVARIGEQIAAALAAIHAEGIVHRDLKPENVMVRDRYGETDLVKVLDFGLAQLVETAGGDARLTHFGSKVGSPLYMSPEYIEHGEGDHRMDLYALGVILFQMITGVPPFKARNPYAIMQAHCNDKPPDPSELGPEGCPEWLESLILALLEKKPDDRPATAQSVKQTLEIGRLREEAKRGTLPIEEITRTERIPSQQPAGWQTAAQAGIVGGAVVLGAAAVVGLGALLARVLFGP